MSLQTSVDEDQESQAASWPAGILLPGGERGEPGAYPRDASIHALFEAEAGAAPDAVALEDPERSVTYGELNRRADRLAHYLLALGIRPGDLVGLCLGRSVELVTGMLAALKAGGAYLPLDPAYPAARLSFMLADAAPAALITTRELAAYLPAHGAREILLDVPLDGPALADGEAPVPEVAAEDLAYVLFTSGSTGRPKGVEVPHRGVVRLVRGNDFARFGPDEVFLHLTSPTFDLSTFEVWGALLNGGRLALFPGRTPSLTEIGEAIQRHGVTTLWLTSGLFHSMVDESPSGLRGLRQLLAGGDVVSPTHARRALAALPGCTLINGYGPTENTTFTCCHSMARAADVEAPVPIGLAIGQTSVHILDGGLLPVPAGEAGELCTGGDGLARGYLRRPDLTAERFVPDPFGDGDRLYRTGDLARSRPDGAFDFLGRADRQVKVRGFRIELGEIEETLLAHPVVAAAVVAAREDRDGDKVLVAYVVAREEGGRSDGETLRAFLAERLPDFMVPPFVVQLPALPLDPNGKVDRAALPAPDLSGATAATAGTAPRTPLEETLAGLWRELLGLSEVGVHDDFFALGGHSLLAGRLVARLRSTLGAELTLRDFSREPTIAGLATRLAPAEELPRFEAAPRDVPLPLSYNQERVWFLDRLVPGNLAYNTQLTVHFEGPLDPGVYRWALREIVKRHEIFRTAFLEVDGRPVQVIQPPSLAATVELPVVDLTGLPREARPAESERLVALFVSRRFELDRPPLARWALLRLAAEEHVLIQSEHHFVHDGWSISLLLREMEVLYGAFAAGRLDPASALPPLPPVATQYAEFVLWQRRLAEGPAMRRQLDYWKRKLAGCPAALELPADRPRPAMQSLRGAAPRPQLPLELCRELRALARREKTTLFHVALAAFQTLLHRYTGEEDLLVGSAVANRRVQELEAMIGMVVNMVVLRTSLAGGPPFRELLGRTRETCLEAQAHEDAQLDRIVEEIAPERHLSRNPLFQVMFSFHDSGVPDLEFAGLRGQVVERPNGSAKMDLNIIVVPRAEQRVGRERRDDDGIAVLWEYSTDLFEAPTIERMIGHYLSLLEGAVGDPDRRLADLPLLSATERRQLLVEWNDTPAVEPDATLHELVLAQAARTPEAVALVHRDHQLTYGELARRSLGLARRLRALGIGPEARVAVCLERSPELVAALLGTLAAGAAYVPLDPAYPAERLAFMREDSGAMAVVGVIGDLPAAGVPVLSPYETAEEWAGSAALPGNLAYLIYTSGSTGRPKGVAIEHRSATALIHWALELFPAADLAGVFAATSVCFDLSIFELFVPLAAGGTVVLGRDALALAEPAEVPAPDRVTLINTVPSAMTELLRLGAVPPSVRTVNLAGEPLKASLAREVRARTAARRLFDLYGPSEDTTYSTFSQVEPDDEREPREPAIGRPVAGTRAYLVDRWLGLVPAGIPGELCLGGAGLARGYLGRPELTAERFVPDPFGDEPGGRLYRTGDLARFRATGEIDFLGRVDHQVKVRGFRVELGEVEAALAACPGVREATAEAREGSLVAWIVPEIAGEDLTEALARQVGQRLPAPLVPSRYVMVEALPLTLNGKVDRRALARRPLPETGEGHGVEDGTPRGPVEELLAGIWSRLLNVERIGRDDRFFTLGGHSLLGTQVVSRVRDTFGVDLPLRVLFERPTIARLAEAVEAALAGEPPEAGRIPRIDRDSPLPLSFGQERLWVMERLSPGRSAYHMSRAYTLAGALDAAALEAALNEVVRRHEALRTAFGTLSGRPVQTVLPDSPAPLPKVDLSGLPEALREGAVRELTAALVRQPFDLTSGQLLRAALLRRSEGAHVLVLVLHHIASDGLSIRLLSRELSTLYAGFAAGRPSPLPEPAVQYADWAAWQRQRLQGEALAGHLAVWRRRLAGAPTVLDLPTDRPRPETPSFRGGMLRRTLGERLRRAIEELAREQGVTSFMALFTGFALLLARWSGRRDLLIGVDAAQRDRLELEGLIGLFVNQLVLRADLTRNPALRTVLQRTREVSLEAFTHQELPFDKLVEDLRPEREPGRNPLFQVMFVFQDAPDAPPDLAGLDVSRRELEVETAPFDLTLFVTPLSEGAEGAKGAAGGLQAALRYSADLFTAATADRLLRDYEALLERLPRNLDIPLESFAMTEPSPVSPVSGAARKNPRREAALDSLIKVKPKAVDLERQVHAAEGQFPVVLRPGLDGVDAVAWAAAHRAALEEELRRSGAVLLRGFGLHDTVRFQELVRAAFGDLIEYGERSSPRSRVDGRVYTSTDHPADQEILLHTEQSYTLHWPLKICFCCLRKAARGGETPIADTRRILAHLRPEVVEAFERRQVLYVRNYGSGLGLPWTEVFQTTDRAAAEAYCRASHIEVEWRGDDGLRTRQVRPAVRRHPRTREKVWFNHGLFFHVTSLPPAARDSLLASFAEEDLPVNTYYGDGGPIEPEVLEEIRRAYRDETVSFTWEEGDVLLLDNMLAAHGRAPFEGERRVVVAMAEPISADHPTEGW